MATIAGLYRIRDWPELLFVEPVLDVAGEYVLVGGRGVQRGYDYTDEHVVVPGASCLLWTGQELFAGTEGAHVVRVGLDGRANEGVPGFDHVAGRDTWHTPHGGPPSARTAAVDDEGRLYVNVHVGGIPRSDDGGHTWQPTVAVDADVHEVITVPGRPGMVLAATARGMAVSDDHGEKWRFVDDGLFAVYSRAVAVGGDTVFLSASEGPGGEKAAVYRRALGGTRRFGKCRGGFPEHLAGNVDSGCIAASGRFVVVGTPDGRIIRSEDSGLKWAQIVTGLPRITRMRVLDEA